MIRPQGRPLLIICLLIIDFILLQKITVVNKPISDSNQSSSAVTKNRSLEISSSSLSAKQFVISPTNSPTLTPSLKPKQKIAVLTPTPIETQETNYTLSSLLKQVNDFRSSKGIAPVQTDGYTCALATTRAKEIANGFNHDGFNNRVSSHTLPYPSYSYVNENLAENSDPNQVVPSWIASPGHNEELQKDTPFACIARFENFYAYEGWKP